MQKEKGNPRKEEGESKLNNRKQLKDRPDSL